MPHILVSNDDGIFAPGIACLVEMLRSFGEVTVVAPDGPRSGASSQITTSIPLTLTLMKEEKGVRTYRCSGSPADCVKLALNTLFTPDNRPDLVVTGVNHGRNDGICVLYSGTVGAALEGCLAGIPSLAVSVNDHSEKAEMQHAIRYAREVVLWMLSNEIPRNTMLNLNLPKLEPKGLWVAPQTVGRFMDEFVEGKSGNGRPVYWMVGSQVKTEEEPNTDWELIEQGYATLTPIRVDLTDRAFLPHLQKSIAQHIKL